MNRPNKDAISRQSYIRLINKTEDYIEQHLKEPLSLKLLAKNAHLSEFYFHRIFKRYSEETVNEFVTRFKLERAAIFLCVNPRVSITTIAMEYGYNDSSSFSRTFKKHFGVSPINYRKQQELSRKVNWFME
ncbi:helix-turn-helix transcriptional regulator [Enterococcus rivorum]|uniref:AraC family transcriptional regulator n=1 Tax=Enterococcus rivorum TaxID=762845 RepID=A0A1E5KSL3_9ENTE|nr:AraC family transcriptional regulator [Enterococcus rivorum]MBP2098212.1 AraC family transcriptional regulator [Enterococcus rivorum]OEH80867.1 AraC family transcriptional regulator [Enterococcus rivorum]